VPETGAALYPIAQTQMPWNFRLSFMKKQVLLKSGLETERK
jgi:hypothetical protein